jgi:hypothetical protein
MKKITLIAMLMIFSFANAQFTSGEVELTSNTNNNMNVTIETTTTDVTLTLMGPDTKWFAVGFGGITMASVSDVFVYDGTGNFDKVGHDQADPTDDTNQDWTIISNNVDGIYRTIQATRPLSTSDANDYTFINDTSNIDVIWAYGNSLTLGYHGARYWTTITRTAVANINKEKQIQFAMYPNPAKTNLNIVLPSNLENAQVEMYDILGKRILHKDLQEAFNTLDVTNIKAGIYLVKIIGEGNTFGVKQFVKK